MAEAQLVASVVLQELSEELVPPHCELDNELEYHHPSFWKWRGNLPLASQAILRMLSLIYQRASLKKKFE